MSGCQFTLSKRPLIWQPRSMAKSVRFLDRGQTPIGSLPIVGRFVARSVTLYDALETLCRLISFLNSDLHLWLAEGDDKIWFCRGEPAGAQVGRRHLEQYVFLKMVEVARLALGPTWKPAEIKVLCPEAKHVENWETFGSASIQCEQPCPVIAVTKSVLGLPVQNGSPMSIHQAERMLRGNEPARDFAGSLRQVVGANLSEGALNIENAAEIAGVSSRTLKRWLAHDGLTYRKLLDQAKYMAAERLLAAPDLSIREIAHDLGYANATHFLRAFRRWSGMTPGEYATYRGHDVK